ncbi:MAG TPA: GlsB/YeaQ/YmgE family stress response membrane protein [Haliangiales bacterium]|nr:GlsB/YeaQ/YmgE family stress response membrane protein [Haliangiales bacterium]
MSILGVVLTGLIVGAIAKLIMPGKDPGGILITILLGVAGSVVAYFVGRAAGWYASYTDGPGIVASVVGAIVVLAIYRWGLGQGQLPRS